MVRYSFGRLFSRRGVAAWAATAIVLACQSVGQAQVIQRQVAGVFIDPLGMVGLMDLDETLQLAGKRRQNAQPIPGDMEQMSELRKVSLRRLEEAILECKAHNKPIPDDIKYLAGLQGIKYVFVYPDQQDIVLVGPGEGWKINEQGEAVGKTTGKPVMLLDDLLVALRSAQQARQEGISCSINPTQEGLVKLRAAAKSLQKGPNVVNLIEETLGMQTISVTGLPTDSHFAAVLVAADYKMKRLAMGFDESPVRGMPSYMQMIGTRVNSNMLPRWWLAPNYDALLADADGLAFEFRAAGVKCVAEEDHLTSTGSLQRQSKQSGPIKKWADTMTAKYEELSSKEAIFGQLRNCIDMAVVAALISKQGLEERAGHRFTILTDGAELPTDRYNSPKQVPSKATVTEKRGAWLISASGGVQIESWTLADNAEQSESLAPVRKQAETASKTWWWN